MLHLIASGKYKGRTLEEMIILDYPYILRMRNALGPADPIVKLLDDLKRVIALKPVVVLCEGGALSDSHCGNLARFINIPCDGGQIVMPKAMLLCGTPACDSIVFANAPGDLLRFRISLDGFQNFLALRPAEHHIHSFGRLLARAYGIVRGRSERLTRGKVRRFFEKGEIFEHGA